ncbi:hypothetical protein MIR68_004881 [Amoeboaphelidium protococcarum]|nr:hypothetical protein MIR68_004881 [Amoeboaphelidium protococcarum]
MTAVKLDQAQFKSRFEKLRASLLKSVGQLLVITGSDQGDDAENVQTYQKSTALQTWLFGYEFPDVCMLLTTEKLVVYCSQKKAQILQQLQQTDGFLVEACVRTKDADQNKQELEKLMDYLESKTEVGVFVKDRQSLSGKVIAEFKEASSHLNLTERDASAKVASCMAIKDGAEIELTQLASKASDHLLNKYFVDEMTSYIDSGRKITHEKLAEKIEGGIANQKIIDQLLLPPNMETDMLDLCYTPIIQSKAPYDFKPSAQSNGQNLSHTGVITASLGVRYKSYCSNIARSFLINPSKDVEENYKFLLRFRQFVLSTLIKSGMNMKQAYDQAVEYIGREKPELKDHFVKNLGFVTGIEFRESSMVIGNKSADKVFQSGMTVVLILGFSGLKTVDGGKEYGLVLGDTLLVGEGDSGAKCLTGNAPEMADIVFYLSEEQQQKQQSIVEKTVMTRNAKSAILDVKLRNEAKDDVNSEQLRRKHQKQLLTQRVQEGMNRYGDVEGGNADAQRQVFRRYESYKKESQVPKEVRNCRIIIDKRAETVILPIMGYAVPFHLNTLKNLSKNEEGDYCYLRFNFNTPGQTVKKDENLPYDDPNATFVRSFTFRSNEIARFTELYKQITECKRDLAKREAERKQRQDLVEQGELIANKRPLAILQDVNIRPALEGKKLPGDLAIHQNGVRYSNIRGDQQLDILFSNVKHLFFQPCDNELFVILHFHLKDFIMVGKKKTKDIQFIREATDASFDETGNRRRRNFGDEDELMAEQEERRRRQKLNREFKVFAEKIGEVSGGEVEADMPFRELGFSGVPSRSNVLLQPTTECLIHLSDPPFTVITLSEVELAYLERVQFHLKNFDIVMIFKDLTKTPIHINTIPMKMLEHVKEWLDSVDIPFLEGPLNLNWNAILKNVNEDPYGFYEDGGWNTLNEEADDGGEGGDVEDEEDSASEFEPPSEEEEEYEDDDDESDFEEDDDDEEEEDEFSGDSEEDESGEDWDELEKKARREDDRNKFRGGKSSRGYDEDDDEDDDTRPKKKKR